MQLVRAALLYFALAFAGGVTAASDPPSPSGGNHIQKPRASASEPASQSAPEQRGTESAPVFVKSLPGPESEEDAGHKQYERHEKPALDRRLTIGTELLALFTFLLFCFTAGLWWVTYRLSKDARNAGVRQAAETDKAIGIAKQAADAASKSAAAAESTVETMKATAIQQLRAYVAIDSAVLDSNLIPGGMVKVTVEVRNFGQTPAYECRGSVNCAVLDFEGDVAIDFPDDLDPQFIGVIHGGSTLVKSRIRPSISAEDIAGLNAGTKALWLFGQITYAIAFDIPLRTSKFRYLLTSHVPGNIGRDFGLSEHGNHAD